MDIKKLIQDFEKRYSHPPESVYFCGLPITLIKRPGLVLGVGVSVGGYIATSRRMDGRLQIQYSDSTRLFSINKEELALHKGGYFSDIFLKMKECGAKIDGGNILIYENTKLKIPAGLLLLCAHRSFCCDEIPPQEMIKRFDNYEENLISITAKKNRITAFSGRCPEYLPFHNQKYKIVLSGIQEPIKEKEYDHQNRADDAREALISQDMEKFGHILNQDAKFRLGKASKSRRLFDAALQLGDSLGNTVLSSGGIVSIVENARVDTFMHNLAVAYERHYGGCPEFYVTDTRDSGIHLSLPEN